MMETAMAFIAAVLPPDLSGRQAKNTTLQLKILQNHSIPQNKPGCRFMDGNSGSIRAIHIWRAFSSVRRMSYEGLPGDMQNNLILH